MSKRLALLAMICVATLSTRSSADDVSLLSSTVSSDSSRWTASAKLSEKLLVVQLENVSKFGGKQSHTFELDLVKFSEISSVRKLTKAQIERSVSIDNASGSWSVGLEGLVALKKSSIYVSRDGTKTVGPQEVSGFSIPYPSKASAEKAAALLKETLAKLVGSPSTSLNSQYKGAYGDVVKKLLTGSPRFTLSDTGEGSPPDFRLEGDDALRDVYIAAAATQAWGAEAYARKGDTTKAEAQARAMMKSLKSAVDLCGKEEQVGGDPIPVKTAFITCAYLKSLSYP